MARKNTKQEPSEITEAIGYVRVSTAGQADSGLGLEAQQTRIRAYCEAQGWTLAEVFPDAGLSAKTLDRPGLKAAIQALRPGRVLVALKLDRLTRTVRDLDDLTAAIDARGAAWATVEDNFETRTAMGRAMLRIVGVLAQLEREVTAERTSYALQTKKARRERLGTTPLGFRSVKTPDGSRVERVEVVAEEQATVELARRLFDAGKSYRAIAAELAASGHKTKRGGKWAPQTVRCLVARRYLEEITE